MPLYPLWCHPLACLVWDFQESGTDQSAGWQERFGPQGLVIHLINELTASWLLLCPQFNGAVLVKLLIPTQDVKDAYDHRELR